MRITKTTARYASGSCWQCGQGFFRGQTLVHIDGRRYCNLCARPIVTRQLVKDTEEEEARREAIKAAKRTRDTAEP